MTGYPSTELAESLEEKIQDLERMREKQEAWNVGFNACSREFEQQRKDPEYAIKRDDPFKGMLAKRKYEVDQYELAQKFFSQSGYVMIECLRLARIALGDRGDVV